MLPVPTAGLIASLSAYVAVRTARSGVDVFGSLPLTYPPQPQPGAKAAIERRMRGVAAPLGAAPASDVIPGKGARATVVEGDVRPHFDGADSMTRLALPGADGPTLVALGCVLLGAGLGPLPHGARPTDREASSIEPSARAARCSATRASSPADPRTERNEMSDPGTTTPTVKDTRRRP